MRHGKKFNHLSRKAGHRRALLCNMASQLVVNKRIKTTVAKAKALRTYVEPVITKSKTDTTHSRRMAMRYLQSKEAVNELFTTVADKVGDRPGGYTRVIKADFRAGDGAEMAYIELVDFNDVYTVDKPKTKKKRRRRGKKGGSGAGTATAAAATAVAADKVAETTEEVDEVVEDTVDSVEETVTETTETVVEEVTETAEAVEETVADAADIVAEEVTETTENVEEAADEISQAQASAEAEELAENTGEKTVSEEGEEE